MKKCMRSDKLGYKDCLQLIVDCYSPVSPACFIIKKIAIKPFIKGHLLDKMAFKVGGVLLELSNVVFFTFGKLGLVLILK